ncbi:MAG: DinB family protein [Bacteroidetes bacterium]|nr:DinB family protein [Bacteroidota bacterium]
MKNFLIRLFGYDKYANLLLTKTIADVGNPEKPVQLMAHILAAQQVWLARCLGGAPATAIWPDWEPGILEPLINDSHREWTDFLSAKNDDDFEKYISYNDLKGNPHSTKLSDIFGQVLNHGTHHRAQIGQLLKSGGLESLPPTDYIVYARQNP